MQTAQRTNIDSLKTIKNYALGNSVTPSYIYKLAKEQKIETVSIDGVQFVDTQKFPSLKK
jgi:hypothetical protein